MKSKSILEKVAVLTLCIVMLLTGCLQRAGNSDTSDDAGAPNFNQIFGSGNGGTTNNNVNNTGNNNNNNNNNNTANNGGNNTDGSPDDGASNVGPVEYKPISSGNWKQEKFYLSTGAGTPTSYEGLKLYKEAYFNLGEWGFAGSTAVDKALKNCAEVGGIDALPWDHQRCTINKGLFFNENTVRNLVYDWAKYDFVIGYTIWDEVSPGENDANYKRINNFGKFVHKYNPKALNYSLLFPSYGMYTWDQEDVEFDWNKGNYEDYVDDFIKKCNPQVLSFDYYPVLMNALGDTSNWWRDMGLFRERSIRYNLPFWYYYQGSGIAEGKPDVDNDTIFYQMYVGLAYGAKELSEWINECVPDGPLSNASSELQGRYADAKARNKEIMSVGTYMFDKTGVELCHSGSANNYFRDFYTTNLSKSKYIASAPSNSRLILSTFKDSSDNLYLMVVNKNNTGSQSGTIELKESASISKFNPETGNEEAIGTSNTINFELLPGRGTVYSLKK